MLKIGHTIKYPSYRRGDPDITINVPEELETVPGIPTNPREVDWYAREYPLETLNVVERSNLEWANEIRDAHDDTRNLYKEHATLNAPLLATSIVSGDVEPTAKPTGEDVSELIKERARELRFSTIGIARYDARYAYKHKRNWIKFEFEHAVCLGYEQDYEGTQTIPSISGEILHYSTYRNESTAGIKLAEYIRSLGYHAQIHNANDNTSAYIPMFVNAGLGQLGACGYLLSPHVGNRQRLMIITTNARVTYDEPVDYGMHAFCQICQVCVNRCPGRALMRDKIWWRGVEKNKLYFKRCRPIMARYMGCGICMKVCPVQKYGMNEVLDHYAETGQVLGKGTHDLEGYEMPDQGYFGPGEMPVFDRDFFDMPKGNEEEWALESLKREFAESDNKLTEEMMERFKSRIVKAFGSETDFTKSQILYGLQGSGGDRDF